MHGNITREILNHDGIHRAFVNIYVPCDLTVIADKQNVSIRAIIAAGNIFNRRSGLLNDIATAVGRFHQYVHNVDINCRIGPRGVLVRCEIFTVGQTREDAPDLIQRGTDK